jgi:hypothetical protein
MSALTVLKYKYRSKFNVEKEMRVVVTNLDPNVKVIIYSKQTHCSH